MKATRYYQVAEHIFSVMTEPAHLALMQNYEPFRCSDNGDAVFTLTIDSGEAPAYTEETRQEDEGQEIICGKTQDGRPVFEFRWWQQTAGFLVCSADYRKGCLITTGLHTKMAIDNALMVLYALATASKKTVLFHAAVVSYQGRGYMFWVQAVQARARTPAYGCNTSGVPNC